MIEHQQARRSRRGDSKTFERLLGYRHARMPGLLRQPWTAVVIAAFHLIQDEQHTGLEKKCLTPMAAVPITAIGVPIVGLRNPLSKSLRLAGCARQMGPPPLLDRALPHGSYCVPQFHERSFAI